MGSRVSVAKWGRKNGVRTGIKGEALCLLSDQDIDDGVVRGGVLLRAAGILEDGFKPLGSVCSR